MGGSKKNRGTVVTSPQLVFRRRDRNFPPHKHMCSCTITKLVYEGQNDHMCKILSPGIYLLFVSEHFTQKCINKMTLEKVTGLTFCKIN